MLDMQTEPQMHVPDDKADLAVCGNAPCTPAPEGECRTGLTCAANVTSARMLTTYKADAPVTALQVLPCAGLPCAGGHSSRYCGRLSLRGAVLLTAAALLLVAVIVTVPAIVVSTSNSHHAANSTQQLSPQVPLALPCLLTTCVRT